MRFYVVVSELQTAADASAIEGARKLMLTPGGTPEATVDADVVAWVAAYQRADMKALSTIADSIRTAIYTPGTNGAQGTITYSLNGKRPNAVTVSLTAAPSGFFSQLLGQTGFVSMNRKGTAWVASLGSNCVRPMAFPDLSLYRKVSQNPAAASPAPDLDPTQFSNFVDPNKANSTRMFTILGQNQSGPGVPKNDGEWTGFNFTGNAGKPGFTDGIQSCDTKKLIPDASQGVTLPGQANQYVNWATSAITWSNGNGKGKNGSSAGLCAFNNAAYAADCYLPPTSSFPGITINTAWGELLGNGSNGIDFNYVGEFQLLCYYSDPSDKCSNNEPGTPNTGYPEGTIVGYIKTLKSRIITVDDVLGNFTSDVQTIVLVQ